MEAKIEVLKKFKKGMLSCIDELIDQFPEEGDLVSVRVFVADQAPIEDVIVNFGEQILPFKKMILDRNEKFFLNDNDIFSSLDGGKVLHFKKLWLSDQLDDDDRDTIWKWFKYHLSVVEDYKKLVTES
jgi:hypothetical protein